MSESRWDRQKELFEAASSLPREERQAFLERACDDRDLLKTVQDLLVEHDGDDDPIADSLTSEAAEWDRLPERIGPYRILRRIAEGGMGVVYEALQENPERRVAVKVVRGGTFVDESTIRLFRREAQSLGRLKHPNIAAIVEAGHTDDGRHFFAMELVSGEPLDAYVARQKPSTEARLTLFRKICLAIHYAHQRGVIHRDLKPSNIMVGDDGEPKVLDFGLARITDSDVQRTMTSVAGQIQGTLAYMSPEQARGNPADIDARCDVYSLGVILYELIAAELPFDVHRLSLPEALRVICEDAPPPALNGDVETIATKALDKSPDQRYQSAHELAEDIERLLTDQPILARPPSTLYQLKKLVVRHRTPVVAAALIFVVAVAAAIVSSILFVRAENARATAQVERERAEREAQSAERVTDYLVGMFELADPSENAAETVTARDILERGIADVAELDDDVQIQARLREAMGQAQSGLGLFEESAETLTQALESRRAELGPEHLETASSEVALAAPLRRLGRGDEARDLLEHAIAVRSTQLGEEAAPTLAARNTLAAVYGELARYEEAFALQQRVHEAQRRTLGVDDPATWRSVGTLSSLSGALGNYEDAERYARMQLEHQQATLGDKHPDTLETLSDLAGYVQRLDRVDESIELYEQALAGQIELLGEDHLDAVFTGANLAILYLEDGQVDVAEPRFFKLRAYFVERMGEDHGLTHLTDFHIGRIHIARERWREAESALRHAIDAPNNDPLRLNNWKSHLAIALTGQRRFDEAEALLLEANGVIAEIERGADGDRILGINLEALRDLYRAWGKAEEEQRFESELTDHRAATG